MSGSLPALAGVKRKAEISQHNCQVFLTYEFPPPPRHGPGPAGAAMSWQDQFDATCSEIRRIYNEAARRRPVVVGRV